MHINRAIISVLGALESVVTALLSIAPASGPLAAPPTGLMFIMCSRSCSRWQGSHLSPEKPLLLSFIDEATEVFGG